MEPKILIAILPPDDGTRFEWVDNDLPTAQRIVGGDIEMLGLDDSLCLICNEDGKGKGLPLNRFVAGPGGIDWIAGNFFVARRDDAELASLEDRDVARLEGWNPRGLLPTCQSGMNLYWVTTDDHAEDWFVLAKNRRSAAAYFVDFEGYDTGDATAELILKVPDKVHVTGLSYGGIFPSYARTTDLLALGLTSLGDLEGQRSFSLGSRVFVEGSRESEIRHVGEFENE